MNNVYDYVLIGGMAAVFAAQNIREQDEAGTILLVHDEAHPPYDRPPLSKQMLAKDEYPPDDAYSKYDDFYPKNRVMLHSATKAEKIDRNAKTVSLSDGTTVGYKKLLIATGSAAKELNVDGSSRPGVLLLRSIDDALFVRTALQNSKKAVIVGAGYLGMEAAAAAADRGLDVTILERNEHPWARFASPKLGGFIRSCYEKKGVKFLIRTEVSEFEGMSVNGPISAVMTKSGERLPAHVVIAAVGATLNLDLAQSAGLEVDAQEGVRVNEFLQTSDPNIWAAGDIACFNDIALGKTWHAEHHLNAKWQGQAVGKIMAGGDKPFDQVAYFFSDFFDLHMILRGSPEEGSRSVIHGDLEAGEFTELYYNSEGRLVMGVSISHEEPKLDPISDTLEALLRAKATIEGREAEIQSPGFDLAALA